MSGCCTRVSNAIKGLTARGHEICVVTAFPHYPQGEIPSKYKKRAFAIEGNNKLKVIRVWVPPLPHEGAKRLIMYASFTLFSLLSLAFSGKVDVVWAVSPNYFCSITGILYKIVKRKPLALDVVDLWPEALVDLQILRSRFLARLVGLGAELSYKLSDRVITLNPQMKNEIVKQGADPNKVGIVPNMIDFDVFRPLNVERPTFLKDKFVVMYSGNLGLMYDFDTLLEASKEWAQMQDLIVILRGNGERAQEIRQRIKTLNICLWQENVDPKRTGELLNLADVLLLPMRKLGNSEVSFPIKLIEYMSCGKPVVACAQGATANLVDESKGGLIVEPGNRIGLSNAIRKLLGDREYCGQLGKNGRDFVVENFSCERITMELHKILSNLDK